jgi:hypothetical protein
MTMIWIALGVVVWIVAVAATVFAGRRMPARSRVLADAEAARLGRVDAARAASVTIARRLQAQAQPPKPILADLHDRLPVNRVSAVEKPKSKPKGLTIPPVPTPAKSKPKPDKARGAKKLAKGKRK